MDSFRPLVRFAGFEGEWEIERFGDIIEECFDKSTIENEDTLLSSSISGMYLNSELFGHQRGQSNIGYRKVRKNMLVLSAQNLHLGNANVNLRFDHGLVSPAYKIYDIIGANPEFMAHWIKREQTKDFFLNATTEGASLCRKNIIWEDLYDQYISLPSLPEQQKISEYFTEIDRAISLQTQKLSKLKQIKAASLQNMFPHEGQMLPKVRFAGFEGEWERVRLWEMFDRLKHNSLSRAELCDEGEIANIHYGDVLIHYGECIDTTKDNLTYIKDEKLGNSLLQVGALRKGDVIFADAAEDNTVGKCSELICNESEQIVSGLHTIACRPLFPFAERYLGYCLNSPSYHNQLLPLIQGTKVSSISFKSLSQTLLLYPHDYKEQQAIANYFTKLDRKIELETQKLAKLKQIKSACLSKMFV